LNNITEFNYEIEEFNNTGLTYCWVNISETIDNDTDYQFIVYYTNPNAVDGQNIVGVWHGDYKIVHHLNETSMSDTKDSTVYDNDVTSDDGDPNYGVDGYISGCFNYSDGNEYFKIGDDSDYYCVNNLTMSFWVNQTTNASGGYSICLTKKMGGTDTCHWSNYFDGTWDGLGLNRTAFYGTAGEAWNQITDRTSDLGLGSWHHVCWTYNSSVGGYIYLDGVYEGYDGTTGTLHNASGNDVVVGDEDGRIDEFRLMRRNSSASWIKADFHTQNQTDGFMTFYGEMPPNEPPNAPSSLECDNQTNPDHVLDHSPWFDWVFSDPDFDIQDGFHIQVGNDTNWASAEMWDNNESNNGDNFTNYAGLGLNDSDTYYWRVKTKDNNSDWGAWSTDQNFRMNSRPTIPSLSAPGNNSEHMPYAIKSINLSWSASTDAEFDSLNYWYQYAKDSGFSDTLVEGWTGGPIYKKIPPAGQLDQDDDYYWRVKTWDGLEWGNYSEWRTFHTDDGLSVFTVYGLSNPNVPTNYGNVTWVGYNDTSTWSNCTEPGGTLEFNMTINSTNNITEIRVWLDDLDEIGASNITLYTSSDNSSYGSSGAFLNEGSNISINKSTWNAGTMGSNPFLGVGLTSTNTSVYFRFLLDIPASATNGTHSQSDWKIYIGED